MRLAMGGIVGSYLLGCLVWLVLGALPPVEHLVLPLLGASRVLAASGERRAASGEGSPVYTGPPTATTCLVEPTASGQMAKRTESTFRAEPDSHAAG